ncbi:Ankyrin-1 [Tetrabaena socialis]|uniref:Ankyrin-1 n=1 Tax=Tetrabaena socialis TaxID=47790 RepID=A0A2J7ZK99_9CHLO|nr:Ankyrin-1 [Tetrabaena socialis]|eukprot:PNH00689.1 Ankyrin-1 [Tetrabaena socialis]
MALHVASGMGHTAVVEALLRAGADKGTWTKTGATDLHIACQNGHTAVVEVLLAAGVDMEAKDMLVGRTALFIASQNGHTAVVEVLLAAGADTGPKEVVHGITALHVASGMGHTAVVKALLQAGADKGARTKTGATDLHIACQNGHTAVVEVLLAAGVDMEAKDMLSGTTALHAASDAGHTAVVKLLLAAGADMEAQAQTGATALFCASYNGHTAVVETLLAAGANKEVEDEDGWTALDAASQNSHMAVMKALLAADADPEAERPEVKAVKGAVKGVQPGTSAGFLPLKVHFELTPGTLVADKPDRRLSIACGCKSCVDAVPAEGKRPRMGPRKWLKHCDAAAPLLDWKQSIEVDGVLSSNGEPLSVKSWAEINGAELVYTSSSADRGTRLERRPASQPQGQQVPGRSRARKGNGSAAGGPKDGVKAKKGGRRKLRSGPARSGAI